jgi:hypothetical protein
MRVQHTLYDGSVRPGWAGPVTVQSHRHPGRQGRPSRSVDVSGVVLPVEVPGRYRQGSGSHSHTGGLSLGFPDLTEHLLSHPTFSRQWSRVEPTIASAAAQVMGWGSPSAPRSAARSGVPDNALELRLSGMLPREGMEDEFDPDEYPLIGSLHKVFPITDVGGRNLRMQSVGSPANLRVGRSAASFSRDPRRL